MGQTRDQKLIHNPEATAPRRRKRNEAQPEGTGLARSTVKLTAELVEGFVEEYLSYKYDGRVPTPQFHREMWQACCADDTQVLCLAPRGHAKSTAITEAYGLAAMLFRVRDYCIIISNTFDQSVEFLRDITAELRENDKLREDFGVKRFLKDREDDIVVEFTDGHKFRMVARGAEQKIRGRKWNKKRPNLILFDDLEDDEQVITLERRQKFKRWFMNAVLPAGSTDCLFRGSATILHFDSLAQNLSEDPTWLTVRFAAHKSFSDFSDILWPERFSEAKLRRIQQSYIKQGNRDGYSQEYLNKPIAEGESFFRPSDLLPLTAELKLLIATKSLRFYAAWDFAISQKTGADYTVGIVVGVDSFGRKAVVDVRRGRWASDEIIDEMFAVQKAWDCECHWAEAGQIEKAIAPFLYKKMREENKFFNVEPCIPAVDKVTRATSWRAETRAHNVYYDKDAEWWEALLEEMTQFPKGAHDDQIDPQSILGMQLEGGLQNAPTAREVEEEEYAAALASQSSTLLGRCPYGGY